MNFIGQRNIINQLRTDLPYYFENPEEGCNILIRGPSGYGKTTLALSMCRYLAGPHFQIILEEPEEFIPRKRVVFWDEIHDAKRFERLYHIMDAKKHVLIFATNIDGNLPEAFQNRCDQYIFEEYLEDELMLIAFESCEFRTTDDSLRVIIESGNRNPRIIKSICGRLNRYFKVSGEDSATADFRGLMENILNIKEGLDYQCRRYLDVLEDLGGTSGVSLLQKVLNIDMGTISREIEPVLLRKKLIRITSRGRSINKDVKN